MKTLKYTVLLLGVILATSCSVVESTGRALTSAAKSAGGGASAQSSKKSSGVISKVYKGMTKSQVAASMGSPRSRITRNGVEIWRYTDSNIWAMKARSIAPMGLGLIGSESTQEVTTITFRNGRVSKIDKVSTSQSANPWRFN